MHWIFRASVIFPIALSCFSYFCLAMETANYSCTDLNQLLSDCKSHDEASPESVQDRWGQVNFFREMVSHSLNKGLSDLVEKDPSRATVEIGCGVGYRLSAELDNSVIRLQPDLAEFDCLVKEGISNIYPINIGQFCEIVSSHSEKSVAHYLAINVFDTMHAKDREANLQEISKTQKKGDKLSVVLDVNPELISIISEIIFGHPEMIVLPYIPAGHAKDEQVYMMSAILLPKSLSINPIKMDAIIFEKMLREERTLRAKQMVSQGQNELEWAKNHHRLTVIPLEEYFAHKMKELFEKNGYTAKSYYHTTFCEVNSVEISASIKQPILYKSVCDSTETVLQWSHKDANFLSRLEHKGLSLPAECNDDFIDGLQKNGRKLVGAELLIIEGVKK